MLWTVLVLEALVAPLVFVVIAVPCGQLMSQVPAAAGVTISYKWLALGFVSLVIGVGMVCVAALWLDRQLPPREESLTLDLVGDGWVPPGDQLHVAGLGTRGDRQVFLKSVGEHRRAPFGQPARSCSGRSL